jgi:hypothetical protein
VSKARYVEATGFAGARVTGNPLWLQSDEDWAKFCTYEETVHQAIRNERLIALCTYPMNICESKTMLNTLSAHSSTLLPRADQWQRLLLSSR